MGSNYFFVGDPAPSRAKSGASPNFISPSSHKSWMHIAPTVTSWPYDMSMASAPYILNTEKGDFAVMKTANNIFATPISDYNKHGYFSQQYDFGMDSWNDAGSKAKPAMFDEVALPNKSDGSLVLVSFGEKQARFMHGDTYLRKYVSDIQIENWPLNNIGVAFHKVHNAKQDLMKYYSSENGRELVAYLKSLGYTPAAIDEIGVVNSQDAGIYGVAKYEGRVIFIANEKAKEMLARWGNVFGATTEEMVEFAFDEEETHLSRDLEHITDTILDEIETKEIDLEFYGKRIAETSGEKKRSYQRKAKIRIDDIDTTPEKYSHLSHYSENLGSLVKSLTAEARRIGADPSEYVSNYLAAHPAYAKKGKDYGAEKDGQYDSKNTKSTKQGKGKKSNENVARADARNADAKEAESNSNKESDSQDGNSEPAGESGGASN